jgi:uncharacterized membrane protein
MTETGRPVPHPSHASAPTRPATAEGTPAWTLFAAVAITVAIVSVGSLAILLLMKLAGAATWSGLVWIAMIGLPVAFAMMGVSLLRAVARRRSL